MIYNQRALLSSDGGSGSGSGSVVLSQSMQTFRATE